jgi:hypothetical protein
MKLHRSRCVLAISGLVAAAAALSCSDPGQGDDESLSRLAQPEIKQKAGSPPIGAGDGADDLTVETFGHALADSLCSAYARSCNIGEFDRTRCRAVYTSHGFEQSLVGWKGADLTRLHLNTEAANSCLEHVATLPSILSGSHMHVVRAACFAALEGQQPIDTPCNTSVECADGVCSEGVCAPLRGKGESCATPEAIADPLRGEDVCSYRGSGAPALRCDSSRPGRYLPSRRWRWESLVKNGRACSSSVWCESGLCDPNGLKCRATVDYFGPICGIW